MSTIDDLFDPRRLGPLWDRVHEEEEEKRQQDREEERSEQEAPPPLLLLWSELERTIVRELGPRSEPLRPLLEQGALLLIEQVGKEGLAAAAGETAPPPAEGEAPPPAEGETPPAVEGEAAPGGEAPAGGAAKEAEKEEEDPMPTISLAKLGSEGGIFYSLAEKQKVASGLGREIKERIKGDPLGGADLQKNQKSLGALLDEIEDLYEAMKVARR